MARVSSAPTSVESVLDCTQERIRFKRRPRKPAEGGCMEVLYSRCAGLDVHKESVSVCVLTPGAGAEPEREIRQYATTTGALRELAAWLRECGVTHAAMESTGVYWKPIFNILESCCELILVNAQHIKQVPGRKTDKNDCAWIAKLLRAGLLQASFIPPLEVRQLRDLCRMRTTLVR